jgi:transglutaminase-like putative cysteine protease
MDPHMIIQINVHLDYALTRPGDILLQVEAAAMVDQRLIDHRLDVTSSELLRATEGEESIGQRTWASGSGNFVVDYAARVEISRALESIADLADDHPRDLPALIVPYLMPSRYCESDRFENFVWRNFSGLAGGAKIEAMRAWIAEHIDYVCGASDVNSTAATTFVQRQGVCRDFAHLLATLARAGSIPARLVSAYAPDVSPPDFHAVVEVWLAGSWHLIDATGMASADEIVRIGVGRDATDIAFMTAFGHAEKREQIVQVTRVG